MLQPLGNRIVIEVQHQEEKTAGGIVLPEQAKEKPTRGKVIAVGKGKMDNNGKRTPIEVSVGDLVLFNKYAGTEVEVDDKKYLILQEQDILGVLDENHGEQQSAEKEMVTHG